MYCISTTQCCVYVHIIVQLLLDYLNIGNFVTLQRITLFAATDSSYKFHI